MSAALTGLSPNTTYHYRLVATNPSDTTLGADHAFTTNPAANPPLPAPPRARQPSRASQARQGELRRLANIDHRRPRAPLQL